MGRLTPKELAGLTYKQFDEGMSDTNSYLNIRDLQTFQRNQNLLLAQVMRRSICTTTFREGSLSCVVQSPEDLNSICAENNTPILRMRAPVSVHTKRLRFWLRGTLVSAEYGASVRTIVQVSDPAHSRTISRSRIASLSSHGSTQDITNTVSIPYISKTVRGAFRVFDVALLMLPHLALTDILVSGPIAIGSSTTTSVTCASAGLANITVGDIIDPQTEEKRIVKSITSGGGNTTLTVYGRWDTAPTVQLDGAYHVPTVDLDNFALMEEPTSTFDVAGDYIG